MMLETEPLATPTTTIAQQIAEAIDRLPLALQRLVLEFAEFLLSRLGPETEIADAVDTQENGHRPAVSNLGSNQSHRRPLTSRSSLRSQQTPSQTTTLQTLSELRTEARF